MPLNPPKRLAVQMHISDLIAAIDSDTDAGYSTASLAGKVFRGRASFGDGDPIPMVSILEPEELADYVPHIATGGGKPRSGSYDLIIQGWVEDDPQNPTDPAHWLAADVTRALALECRKEGTSQMLGGYARGLQISPPTVRPSNEFSDKANFILRVTMTLVEDLESPFA